MKTTYKYIKKTLPFVWAGLCLVSCNDFLTEDPKDSCPQKNSSATKKILMLH